MEREVPVRSMPHALSFVALCLIATAAAAAIEVEVARTPDIDYSNYHSFAFRGKEGTPEGHPLGEDGPLLKRVQEEATQVLLKRGLTLIKGGEPDVWISFFGLVSEGLAVTGTTKNVGSVKWVGDPGAHSTRTSVQGTLIIEMFDAESDERVWSGWATAESKDRDKLRARAEKMTRKILEAFPVE